MMAQSEHMCCPPRLPRDSIDPRSQMLWDSGAIAEHPLAAARIPRELL
jgi:hypothetical protein